VKEVTKEDYQNLLKGIRTKLNLSQRQLSEKIGIPRRQIGKYERGHREPKNERQSIIEDFIENQEINKEEFYKSSEKFEPAESLRTISEKKEVKFNEEFAELTGIIIGDGELSSDGQIRVSFNPHNEQEYIKDRTKRLLEQFSESNVSFESEKRIRIGDKALVLTLKSIGLNPGNKFENNWEISEDLVSEPELRRSVLRGLFDTDGTFHFDGQRTSIEYGRFTDRSKEVVEQIDTLLEKEGIAHRTTQCGDTRWRIRITDTVEIRKFFLKIGSSNYKHISRYLAWRENRKAIEVTKKSLEEIMQEAEIEKSDLGIPFKSKDQKDRRIVAGQEFRSQNDISKIVERIYDSKGYDIMVKKLDVNKRTIRRWRNGKRTPAPDKSFKIKQIAEA